MTSTYEWESDKCVTNWFELIGNERTISNYRHDFAKFLNFIAETTEYKTPSEIIKSRLENLIHQARASLFAANIIFFFSSSAWVFLACYFVKMGLAMFSTTKQAILSMLLRVSAPKDAKLFGIMSSSRVEYSVGR